MNLKTLSIKFACTALLFGAVAATGCGGSDDETGGSGGGNTSTVAVRATLSLGSYYDENSNMVSPLWKQDVKGTLVAGVAGEAKVATATAMQLGSQKGEFLFNIAAPSTAVPVASWYPAEAAVKCVDATLKTRLETNQTGVITPLLLGHDVTTVKQVSLSLMQYWCTMFIRINKGSHTITKATVKANNGENIAGDIAIDMAKWTVTASEPTISVTPAQPLDCSVAEQSLAVMLPPVTLSKGYTVTLYTTDGSTFTIESDDAVELKSGRTIDTSGASSTFATKLLFCGNTSAIIIDAATAAATGNYREAIEWEWNSEAAASVIPGLAKDRCRVGEGKIVDNGNQILFMGSTGWCALVSKESKQISFYTTNCPNVHSGDVLPGGFVALACSTGTATYNNKVMLYNGSGKLQGSYDLQSAHGIVWNSATERLYALGGKVLQIYKFVTTSATSGSLVLEREVPTPVNSMHDLMLVTPNILTTAGKGCYLYDIANNSFSPAIKHFSQYTGLKSVNYNMATGEAWYTDATVPEGNQEWSTHTLRYTSDIDATTVNRTIRIEDIDVYKVRVYSW